MRTYIRLVVGLETQETADLAAQGGVKDTSSDKVARLGIHILADAQTMVDKNRTCPLQLNLAWHLDNLLNLPRSTSNLLPATEKVRA